MAFRPSGKEAFMLHSLPLCAVNGAFPDGLKAILPFLDPNFFKINSLLARFYRIKANRVVCFSPPGVNNSK
jgi:hypothetical protein